MSGPYENENVLSMQDVTDAVNEFCTCGGGGSLAGCIACKVYHAVRKTWWSKIAPKKVEPADPYVCPTAICPHCGYEMQDALELGLDDGDDVEAECGRCGKKYRVTLYISVKYSTEKDGGTDAC